MLVIDDETVTDCETIVAVDETIIDTEACQEGLVVTEAEAEVDTVCIDLLAERLGVDDTQTVTLELPVAQDSVEVPVGAVEADMLYVASADVLGDAVIDSQALADSYEAVADSVADCDCAGETEFAAVYDSTEGVADVD